MRVLPTVGLALVLLALACSDDDAADPASDERFDGYQLAVTDEAVSPEQQAVVQRYDDLLDRAESICAEDRAAIAALAARAHDVTSGAVSAFDALTLIDQSLALSDDPVDCRFVIALGVADAEE
jgi:hypothetical protein